MKKRYFTMCFICTKPLHISMDKAPFDIPCIWNDHGTIGNHICEKCRLLIELWQPEKLTPKKREIYNPQKRIDTYL